MVKVIDRAHKNTLYILTSITLLSGAILTSTIVSADDIVDQVNITVPASCTLSSTGEDSHNAEITNGTYNSSIGETTIKAFCNDNNGFAIYAIGFTNNEYGKTVLTDSTLGSTYDIVTGTATSGNTSNWAMKLSTVTSPTPTYPITIASDTEGSFSSFHTVPATYTLVASRNSATDIGQNAEGSTLKTTYQTYISTTQLAGTYTGKVKYTMVHPYTAPAPSAPIATEGGKICYYANASDAVGTMGCQTVTDSNTGKLLLASNFSRSGYGFAGWSDSFDYTTNPNAHLYGPNELLNFTAGQYNTPNPGLSLYAVWIPSAGSFQDSTKVSGICGTGSGSLTQAPIDGTANLSSVSALTDQRDNQTYAIAKLADGKCWMIENLRLDNTAAHNSDGTLAQGYGTSTTYGNFAGLADAESTNFKYISSSGTVANSLYSKDGSNGTINIGTSNRPDYRIPRYNNLNTSSRAQNNPNDNYFPEDTNTDGGMYSFGNYYTWAAAMANTIYYEDPTYTDANNKTSETVNTSICPSGWRLPYGRNVGNGNTPGGFYYLIYKINNDSATTDASAARKLMIYPNNLVLSGYFSGSIVPGRGVNGSYWTSTTSTIEASYDLYFSNGFISYDDGYSGVKTRGSTIRCVVDL